MNTFNKALNNLIMPGYVDKLGMSHAPFSELYDAQMYYENDNKKETLKKIAYLLEYTQLILCIQGANGVGKTTLLKNLLLKTKPNWKVCYLSAKDYTTSEALINKLATDLDLTLVDHEQTIPVSSLQEQIQSLCDDETLPILIIDDIEQLKETLLPLLLSFINPIQSTSREQAGLRLIIAGEDIPQFFLNAIPKDDNEEKIKYLPVLPLSEMETGEYIQHRLQVSGYEKKSPFSSQAINKIYLDAKGFPKTINQLANHILTQYAQGKIEKPALLGLRNNNTIKLAAIALILLIIVAVLFLTISTENNETDKIDNRQTENLEIPKKEQVKNSSFNIHPPVTPTQTQAQVETAPKQQHKTPSAEKTNITQEKTEVKPEIKTDKAVVESTKEKDLRWIMQQNPKHYTLQLIGSSRIASVENFITKHNIEKDAHIFSTIRKGKPWFSVIYKSYNSLKQAKQAAESLPDSLKKIKPWIRTFEHIRKDIK